MMLLCVCCGLFLHQQYYQFEPPADPHLSDTDLWSSRVSFMRTTLCSLSSVFTSSQLTLRQVQVCFASSATRGVARARETRV